MQTQYQHELVPFGHIDALIGNQLGWHCVSFADREQCECLASGNHHFCCPMRGIMYINIENYHPTPTPNLNDDFRSTSTTSLPCTLTLTSTLISILFVFVYTFTQQYVCPTLLFTNIIHYYQQNCFLIIIDQVLAQSYRKCVISSSYNNIRILCFVFLMMQVFPCLKKQEMKMIGISCGK